MLNRKKKKKTELKNQDCLRDLCDNTKITYIHIIGVPKKKRKQKGDRDHISRHNSLKTFLTLEKKQPP